MSPIRAAVPVAIHCAGSGSPAPDAHFNHRESETRFGPSPCSPTRVKGKKMPSGQQQGRAPGAVPRSRRGRGFASASGFRGVATVVITGSLLLSGAAPAVTAPAVTAPPVSATATSATAPLAGSQPAASSCTTKRPTSKVRKRIVKKIHRLVNEQRTQNGVAALEIDQGVTNAATKHSRNMASTGIFSHVIDGKNAGDRMQDENVSFTAWGENIYHGWCQMNGKPAYDVNGFAQKAVSGWMNSSGHRKNILNPKFTHTGIGIAAIARDNKGYMYATQVFIKR
jgi:uncharacterized protein YkwD